MFASRTDWDLIPNNLSRKLEELRSEGTAFIDLTESNPTRCGFTPPADLAASLTGDGLTDYDPHPKGARTAREAVAAYYADRGRTIDPDHIVLTASTSEAYDFLFKLLLERGDELFVQKPSYPLVEFLAGLCDVKLTHAPSERTRALLVIHPNNPTGTTLDDASLAKLTKRCTKDDLALLVDEVFLDYAPPATPTIAGHDGCLTFVTSGISKVLGLPQLKLGWIVVSGPESQRTQALARLDTIADTYLSVNTPVQIALPKLLAARAHMIDQISARIADNRAALEAALASARDAALVSEPAGWYAVVRFGTVRDEESFVLGLLEHQHVLVHPGYFFDFDDPAAHVVVSLLSPPEAFRSSVQRVVGA